MTYKCKPAAITTLLLCSLKKPQVFLNFCQQSSYSTARFVFNQGCVIFCQLEVIFQNVYLFFNHEYDCAMIASALMFMDCDFSLYSLISLPFVFSNPLTPMSEFLLTVSIQYQPHG